VSAGEKREVDAALRQLEELIERLDRLPDPEAREPARKLVELILDLHGVALARLLAILASSDGGSTILSRLSEDDQVRPLLLLHGLHPENAETRVRKAVERLRPHLGIHGLRLDLVQVANGTVRVRVRQSEGVALKPSILWSLPMEIEGAIVEAAPDIDKVVIDGLDAVGYASKMAVI
jgi:hypothetical protein